MPTASMLEEGPEGGTSGECLVILTRREAEFLRVLTNKGVMWGSSGEFGHFAEGMVSALIELGIEEAHWQQSPTRGHRTWEPTGR